MNFPFYIARRYLFSKKSTNAINVISGISVLGVAVATMALVVTLSVFNGFSDLVATFFTAFDPQLKVTPTQGKTAPADDPILTEIRQLPQVDVATETVEDNGHTYPVIKFQMNVTGTLAGSPAVKEKAEMAYYILGYWGEEYAKS